VACADPTTETITASTPDIDDGGRSLPGNQQITRRSEDMP